MKGKKPGMLLEILREIRCTWEKLTSHSDGEFEGRHVDSVGNCLTMILLALFPPLPSSCLRPPRGRLSLLSTSTGLAVAGCSEGVARNVRWLEREVVGR